MAKGNSKRSSGRSRAAEAPAVIDLGEVLDGILRELDGAEAVVLTCADALKGNSPDAALVLQRHAGDVLTEEIGRLRKCLETARLQGSTFAVPAEVAHG